MFKFTKEERLCSVKLIEKLYDNGSSFLLYPFRILWLPEDSLSTSSAQVLISVPKKRFKRAVDRNLIKRRIREIYRRHKSDHLYSFLTDQSSSVLLGIHYIGGEILDYSVMEKKLVLALEKFKKEYLKCYADKDH